MCQQGTEMRHRPLCSSLSTRPGRSQELGKRLSGERRISAFRLPLHWKLRHQFFPRSLACCCSLQILDLSVSIIAWTNSLKINFSVYLSSYIYTHTHPIGSASLEISDGYKFWLDQGHLARQVGWWDSWQVCHTSVKLERLVGGETVPVSSAGGGWAFAFRKASLSIVLYAGRPWRQKCFLV